MLYMIMSQGDEPLITVWSDEIPTIELMGEAVAHAWNYESVEALAAANPDLWLGWAHIH